MAAIQTLNVKLTRSTVDTTDDIMPNNHSYHTIVFSFTIVTVLKRNKHSFIHSIGE